MIVYAQLYRKCFVIMQILDILAALGNRKWLLVLLKPGNSLGKFFQNTEIRLGYMVTFGLLKYSVNTSPPFPLSSSENHINYIRSMA